ncbi:hypothetical protein AC578_381 [Pseudocercospora eumusae]|uniref:Uncharacterized protein n=1 Tax=Pseudocercospora eumusae TaxID=321146 RepID=A0A139HU58_9PEZI|nr:hypothetical protein AC578_381 [Pseudocercospora eumusae]
MQGGHDPRHTWRPRNCVPEAQGEGPGSCHKICLVELGTYLDSTMGMPLFVYGVSTQCRRSKPNDPYLN